MALQNEWVGYTTRSYNQIKNSVLTRLGVKVPEVTDHSESNLLVIIISIFAGVAEMLNYYIDNMAREAFITTARRFSSMVKLVKLIDYRIKAANPASVDLLLTFLDSNNDPVAATAQYIIPAGTAFSTGNGVVFITSQDNTVEIGDMSILLGAEEKTQSLSQSLGLTSGIADQTVIIGTNYVDGSMALEVDGTLWELKNTLGLSGPLDQHYIIEISSDKVAYIKFGDGINGAIPGANQTLEGDYYTTTGEEGNVDANTITNIDTVFSIPGVDNLEVNNDLAATGGYGYEDVERIRRNAPLSLRTLDRAVTRSDYRDITLQVPGVDKAYVHFECGKTVDLYIAPIGGGIAQSPLLDAACAWVEERDMVTTFLRCKPAGETYIYMELDVTAIFRADAAITETEIREALIAEYEYANSGINRPIRRSDIIALVDNLSKVDYLSLNVLTTRPYARSNNHNVELDWDRIVLDGSTQITNWRFSYDGISFRLFKEGIYIGSFTEGTQYTTNDNILQFTINASAYTAGMEWNFKTYPHNENLEIDDNTVPILEDIDIVLTVHEQVAVN